jgi:hypothetical protein
MSSSPKEQSVDLTLRGGPGVRISVSDASYAPVAEGANSLHLHLRPGSYAVHFSVAGQVETQLVHIRADDSPKTVSWIPRPSGVDKVETSLITAGAVVSPDLRTAKFMHTAPISRPVKITQRFNIALGVQGADRDTLSAVSRSLAFVDRTFAGSSAKVGIELDEEIGSIFNGFNYFAAPYGAGGLRFTAGSRRKLEQTVHVFRERRVFVLLWRTPFYEMERSNGVYRRRSRFGVDPSLTLVVSAPPDALTPSDEVLSLGKILVHALRNPRRGLDPSLLEAAASTDCPYLRLYAATLAVVSFEYKLRTPGLGLNDWLAGVGGVTSLMHMLSKLVQPLAEQGSADAAITLNEAERLIAGHEHPLNMFAAPPMLDPCWCWLAAQSVSQPGLIPSTGLFRDAAKGREAAAPWLVWNHGRATRGPSLPRNSPEQLETMVHQLLEIMKVRDAAGSSGARSDHEVSKLSRSTQEVLQAIWVLDDLEGANVQAESMARLLGAPAAMLQDRLRQALVEITPVEAA